MDTSIEKDFENFKSTLDEIVTVYESFTDDYFEADNISAKDLRRIVKKLIKDMPCLDCLEEPIIDIVNDLDDALDTAEYAVKDLEEESDDLVDALQNYIDRPDSISFKELMVHYEGLPPFDLSMFNFKEV